jgi:DNA repair photolyase
MSREDDDFAPAWSGAGEPGPAPGAEPRLRPPSKLLKPADLPENFTRSLYKIAPYRGCAHGCRYCDGRAERYYVEGDFERDIAIRSDIPSRLEAELPLVRERGMVAFGSGVTDPYQQLEAANRITGACAELLATAAQPLPALVMTKSSLALRDLPHWTSLQGRAGMVLLVSLTSVDEELRETMEPGASSFASRLEMMRAFKTAGCAVGVLAMPLLPGLSDGEASLRSLYTACAAVGADFVMPGGLTLRPGRQKEFYLRALAAARPELLESTRALYDEERPSGSPRSAASRALHSRLQPIRQDYDLPFLLPHRIFASFLPAHDSLRILFRDMLELYAERGVDTSGLARSAASYDAWLIGLRREFRRKRKLPDTWLEERFADAAAGSELKDLLGNEKLARFCEAVIRDGARLDYRSLKLS